MHALCLSGCSSRRIAIVSTKNSILNTHILINLASCLAGPAAKVDPLAPLPSLHACKAYASGNEYNTPFPVDWRVFESHLIDNGNLDERN